MAKEHSLAVELASLLDRLCTEQGYCSLSPEDRRRICAVTSIDARTFAIEVLKAEGFKNPEYEPELLRHVRNAFIAKFGTSSVWRGDFGG